jgi:2-oxoglutarate dehydrogenase E2 component (dihydrolipoamide succinyltransferase)
LNNIIMANIVEIKVPSIGESVTEVTLVSMLKNSGEYVKIDEALCEFESDKATFELPSEVSGVITWKVSEGDDLKVGDIVATIDTSAHSNTTEPMQKAVPKQTLATTPPVLQAANNSSNNYASGHPSPAAQKILDEKGISPSDVSGTGIGGRITKDDANKAQSQERPKSVTEITIPKTSVAFSREEHSEKMTRLRRTISKRLVAAKNETAMLTTFNEIDMSKLNSIREALGDKFKEKHGVSLGMMSFFAKAVCYALQKFPALNAYIDDENIIYHDYCDISIAVSTPKGLVVPVVRNAESLALHEIEKEIKRLAIAGRDGNLSLDDMQGGTFTISNGGVFGSLMSTPIINPPQSAILGMHKIQERPMVINGKIEIRPMMYVALSYDHRIVDGKESVGFLVNVKELLESPEKLLHGLDPIQMLLKL